METIINTGITSEVEEKNVNEWRWYHLLPFFVLGIFIFTPTLSWKFGLPEGVRWIGDISVVLMIMLAIIRMLTIDRIPGAFLVILALSVIGILVATFAGQPLLASMWGLWTTFRYPLVGIYVYLVSMWPRQIATWLPKVGLGLLAFQVLVQFAFFLSGIKPGDFLSGTFGRKGTGLLILFVMQIIAISFGHWLSKGEWKFLLAALVLGGISSVFGEMKLFVLATPAMAVVAFVIHLLRRGQVRRSLIFISFLGLAVVGYFNVYNVIVSQGNNSPSLEAFLEGDKFDRYLNRVRESDERGTYHIGRGIAGQYAWNSIRRDTVTTLFGFGIGTSQISATFGLAGAGFNADSYGVLAGNTSLMIIMQEMGLVGLSVMAIFIIGTILILFRATRQNPDEDLDVIRFGTLLYTLFWPLWIWYNSAWFMNGPAIMYWIIWGYIIQLSMKPQPATRSP